MSYDNELCYKEKFRDLDDCVGEADGKYTFPCLKNKRETCRSKPTAPLKTEASEDFKGALREYREGVGSRAGDFPVSTPLRRR